MRHFSCDLCGQALDTDRRYVIKLEMFPAFDPEELTAADLDADHLADVAAQLDETAAEDIPLEDCGAHNHRYDLCPTCYAAYKKDPLARSQRRWNFSEN